jgi:proteasome maturation protein
MESSLRIVPKSSSKNASVQDTSNSLGLHDTLQYGPRSLAAEVQSAGNLKGRLENVGPLRSLTIDIAFNNILQWEATQDNLKLTLERNLYGMHAPMRRLMERRIVASVSHA